jgi:hypothetical protein
VGVQTVAACSWLPPTLDEVVDDANYIFYGAVTENPAARSYVVEVERVFRGTVPDVLTFAPDAGSSVSSCEAGLDVGSIYVFGMRSLDGGVLGIGDVWLRLSGTTVQGFYAEAPDLDFANLVSYLAGLPNTSTGGSGAAAATLTATGLAMLIASALLFVTKDRPTLVGPGRISG